MAQKVQTLSFGPGTSLLNDIVQFNAFNPALGTLTGIVITLEYDYTPPVQTTLKLYPESVTLMAGAKQNITPALWDASGNLITGTYTWSIVSGPGSVDPNGVFTAGTSSGQTIVKATDQSGTSAMCTLVTDPTLMPDISLLAGNLRVVVNAYNNKVTILSITAGGVVYVLVAVTSQSQDGTVVFQKTATFTLDQLQQITLLAQAGGIISFTNNSPVPATAFAGTGAANLQSGSGNDYLQAGLGISNTLRGGGGDNVLVGGPGTNNLYGGPGNNTLIPGSGPNFLYPNG